MLIQLIDAQFFPLNFLYFVWCNAIFDKYRLRIYFWKKLSSDGFFLQVLTKKIFIWLGKNVYEVISDKTH